MTGLGTRRWWALAAMSLAVLAITLDVTVLSVAMPTLRRLSSRARHLGPLITEATPPPSSRAG